MNLRLLRWIQLATLFVSFGCSHRAPGGNGDTPPADDGGAAAEADLAPTSALSSACASFGEVFCDQIYKCDSADVIQSFHYPPTKAECVTQSNARCGEDPPVPAFCKGPIGTDATKVQTVITWLGNLQCTQLAALTSVDPHFQGLCASWQ
jgi:hypothetical protein